MQDWPAKDIILTVLGSGTFIGSIIVVFNFITARLDARRARIRAARDTEISDAVEFKRLQIETDGKNATAIEAALWKLIEERQQEITELKIELIECEKNARLDRPLINKIIANLRTMRRELDMLDQVKRTDEERARYLNVKQLLDVTEEMLP